MKCRNVLQINAVKIDLFLSQCCEMFSKGHPACGKKKKNDMNAKLSNIVDGKSMTCMQFSNSSSAAT